MSDQIRDGLERSFVKDRLVVWRDPEGRFREEFEAIEIPKVTKVLADRNEFAVKHRILIEEPDTYFLIYRPGTPPPDEQNWLLDIEIGYGLFTADKADLIRSELNLPLHYVGLVREHLPFFASRQRTLRLKGLITEKDREADIRRQMLAICVGADSTDEAILEALLAELAQEMDKAWSLIARSGLAGAFWDMAQARYGYRSDDPSVADLAQALFTGVYAMNFDEETPITPDASVLLNRWAGMVTSRPLFITLSDRLAESLRIEADLGARPFDGVVRLQLFRAADEAVLRSLIARIDAQEIAFEETRRVIQSRRGSLWYEEFRDLYEALLNAAELLHRLSDFAAPEMTMETGITSYAETWFRVDQLYRKFILHRGRTVYTDHLETLARRVEHLYTDLFVPRLNAAWQGVVDRTETWRNGRLVEQRRFFEAHVSALRKRNAKVIVIISDALRYEAAEELYRLIRAQPRFEAQLTPMLGVIPSYTQLGMAALLPNRELRVQPDAQVRVDGESATGTPNRERILALGAKGDAVRAVQAEDLDRMGKEDLRALIKNHEIVYVYHNVIDSIGDSPKTESEACLAVERALDQLEKLVRRLAGNNANNLIITSDHGFLYQSHPIHEGDFSAASIDAPGVTHESQRFVLGRDLRASEGLDLFPPKRAGLEGDVDILLPRSIARLGRKGKGSRFVHGGASLQEIVIPVITINKARRDDIEEVEVEVIGSGSRIITTGQLTVRLYQTKPSTEKRKAVRLRIGLEGPDRTPISNEEELIFDFTSEDARQRETSFRLLLSKAAEPFNGGEVRLVMRRLDHKGPGDGVYRSETYRYVRRMGGGDFDL
jgi:uncharacterized protein (TIGR02687 family)